MRLALFALILTLPLTACDPDANTAEETPTEVPAPVDPVPVDDGPGGDTGLPDSLMSPTAPDIDSAADQMQEGGESGGG